MEEVQIKLPVLVELEKLVPNPWNPNKVARPEMDLLRVSIEKSGFCFPIIVMQKDENTYMIVDGFHRHLIAKEHIKQCRAVWIKAAAYNQKKAPYEEATLLEAMADVSDYEVEEMFA